MTAQGYCIQQEVGNFKFCGDSDTEFWVSVLTTLGMVKLCESEMAYQVFFQTTREEVFPPGFIAVDARNWHGMTGYHTNNGTPTSLSFKKLLVPGILESVQDCPWNWWHVFYSLKGKQQKNPTFFVMLIVSTKCRLLFHQNEPCLGFLVESRHSADGKLPRSDWLRYLE